MTTTKASDVPSQSDVVPSIEGMWSIPSTHPTERMALT